MVQLTARQENFLFNEFYTLGLGPSQPPFPGLTVNMTIHPRPVPRLSTRGVTNPLLHLPLWHDAQLRLGTALPLTLSLHLQLSLHLILHVPQQKNCDFKLSPCV